MRLRSRSQCWQYGLECSQRIGFEWAMICPLAHRGQRHPLTCAIGPKEFLPSPHVWRWYDRRLERPNNSHDPLCRCYLFHLETDPLPPQDIMQNVKLHLGASGSSVKGFTPGPSPGLPMGLLSKQNQAFRMKIITSTGATRITHNSQPRFDNSPIEKWECYTGYSQLAAFPSAGFDSSQLGAV